MLVLVSWNIAFMTFRLIFWSICLEGYRFEYVVFISLATLVIGRPDKEENVVLYDKVKVLALYFTIHL